MILYHSESECGVSLVIQGSVIWASAGVRHSSCYCWTIHIFALLLLNIIYSEKATKFFKISINYFLAVHRINNWWRFRKILWPSQNIWTLNEPARLSGNCRPNSVDRKYMCIFQVSWIGIDQSQALCACGPCRYFLLFVLCYVKTKWAQMASLFIHSGREINIDQITTYYIRIHLIEQIGTYLDSSGSFLTSAQSKSPRQKQHTLP